MMEKIHQEYHAILVKLDHQGTIRSSYTPWPDPKVAVMCTYGWVERTERYGDMIVLTELGREMLNNAVVVS